MLNFPADRTTESDAAVARALTWRYAIALVLVAMLSSAAWLSLHMVIAEQKSTAAVVNVSGRQRMLSQRTAFFANMLIHADTAARPALRAKLMEATDLMARSHNGLTHGDADMGLPGSMSDAVRRLYFEGEQPLDAQVQAYLNALRRLLASADAELTPANVHLTEVTRTAPGTLVRSLDEMVQLYQREGEASVASLQRAETLFWLLTLLLLLLEAALIFRPFTQHVMHVIGRLQAATLELQKHQDQLEALVERRTAELQQRTDALAEAEEKFRLICTAAQDAIVIVGPDERMVYMNPAAQTLFGHAAQQLEDVSFGSLLVPLASDGVAPGAWLASPNETQRAVLGERFETLARRGDGVQVPVELSVSWVRFKGLWHGIGIIRDISEQKKAQSELRIAAVAFDAQMGMTITDADKTILRVNRAFTDITGYSADEVIGQSPRLLSSGRHDDAFYRNMFRCIRDTGLWAGEIWNRHKNGAVFPEWLTITAVKNEAAQVTHYVAAFSDISERKAAESQIRNLAFYDPLTELPNRRLLLDRLGSAMLAGARHQHVSALLFIDLDNFKTVNDTLGHNCGDLLLQQVAQRLSHCVRSADTVARLGGDEFVVMLEDLGQDSDEAVVQVTAIGNKILHALSEAYAVGSSTCHTSASMGVALFTDGRESVDDLLKRADLSMYQAKASGRNTLRFFDPQVQAAVQAKAALEIELRGAIEQQQLCLYYQAQVNGAEQIVGAEVLVRWLHPQRGMVSPAEFIPLAEQTGLILPLGAWVLETACAQLQRWHQCAPMAGLTLAVNVSARQFHQKDFVRQVLQVLERTGANPALLKLELTESLLLDDVQDIAAKMTELRARGVCFSLDDFGTGYSSLAYLSRLPLDQLKIDQGFVRDIETSENAVAICSATTSLAHSLRLKVVAEGVETQAQRYFLSTVHRCDYMQGYLFSRPLPLAQFEALVA